MLWEVPFCTVYLMAHEDGMDNRIIRLTSQVLKLKSALLNYDQRYSFSCTPFVSLIFMSAPFLTRHSTV